MVRMLTLIYFVLMWLSPGFAIAELEAEPIRLFTVSRNAVLDTVANYNDLIKNLKRNDRLIFPSGKTFVLGDRLGNGQTTVVWALQGRDDIALRLPLMNVYVEYINYSIDGLAELERAKIPHAEVYDFEAYQYLVVQRLKNFVLFEDFVEEYSSMLARRESKNTLPLSQMREDFLSFAKTTALFRKVGDAHIQNLVYDLDSMRWLLLDWSDSHRVAYATRKPLVFFSARSFVDLLLGAYGEVDGAKFYAESYRQKWLIEFYRDARNVIELERKALHGRFLCEDIFDAGFTGNVLSSFVRPR